MILTAYYIGFLFTIFLLLKLPFIGVGLQHGIEHLFDYFFEDVDRALNIFACFVWMLLIGLVVSVAFQLWFLLLADFATLLFIFVFCNQHH